MKFSLILSICFLISSTGFGQKAEYNTKKGYVAEGYDVVSYFDGEPVEGKDKYVATHDEVKYRFASKKNLEMFKANPDKYVPQYGGWCAYAVAENNSKVGIDPETYEIRDGKLYLFYNAFFNNTLESWKEEGPENLRDKADENWKTLKDQ